MGTEPATVGAVARGDGEVVAVPMTTQATSERPTDRGVFEDAPTWAKVAGVAVAAVIAFVLPLVAVSLWSGSDEKAGSQRPTSPLASDEDGTTELRVGAVPTSSAPGLAPLGTVASSAGLDAARRADARTPGSAPRPGAGSGDASADTSPTSTVDPAAEATAAPTTATTAATSVVTSPPDSASSTTTGASPTTPPTAPGSTSTTAATTTTTVTRPAGGGIVAGSTVEVGGDCATPGLVVALGDGRQVECRTVGNSGRARWRAL